MALFTDTAELNRQERHRNFRKTTGNKKVALSMLGYKDDGTKNTFGNIIGSGIGGHLLAKSIATGDTKDVIASSTGEEIGSQMATAKFAMNFIGGGAGNQLLGKMGMGKAGGAIGADAVGGIGEQAAKKASMDALNSGYSEQTIGGKTVTSIGGVDLDEDSLAKYNKFMEENPEGTMEEFQSTQGGVGKGVLTAAKATPILGDLVDVVATRTALDR